MISNDTQKPIFGLFTFVSLFSNFWFLSFEKKQKSDFRTDYNNIQKDWINIYGDFTVAKNKIECN